MPQTPWGALELLRERRPPPGSRGEEAKRRQRELLFAAMVVCCERQGLANTGVADLLEVSGLSRGTFYAHFSDRFECYAAAEAEILRLALSVLERRLQDEGDVERRARGALEAFVDLAVAQPAAARTCLVDYYVAGIPAMVPMAAAVETVTTLARRSLEEIPGGVAMPGELARAIVAGFHKVIYNRIASRRTAELPDLVPALWDWALSYLDLPGPLRGTVRRPNQRDVGKLPPFAALSSEQRIIRAFASVASEKGYRATTVAEVCAAASVSQTTFYRYFADKQDLLVAALHSSGAQLLAAALPSARRAPDWPRGVKVVVEETCNFFACEPEFAMLRTTEVYSGGEKALAIRDRAEMEILREVLEPALAERPDLSPITLEATMGAMVGILYEAFHADGAAKLPRAAPFLTFLALAPLIGAKPAHEVASSKPTESRAGEGIEQLDLRARNVGDGASDQRQT
ncbi:MAG TPA: TetR/AcrR family transcriptional regulator [Solirubrobacterales bacterium]|nr:TetR/AcrR family transcriptional regulator [Solirubrobacterales bacterium]